ncbi:MAG: AAA family ATPase [Coriobacteriia bacterium]|nr:AAA family ATPase [Coriobacteriia bacterium]
MNKLFLKNIHIDSFGSLRDKSVGEFVPDFNIVYGQNEAGKTSIVNFIKGALTGWTKRKSIKNPNIYSNNPRSGILTFGGEDSVIVKRSDNDYEVIGNKDNFVLPDTDNFDTLYCLNSDKLWDLDNEISAKFLTAETGTKISPADALDLTEKEIKQCNKEIKETKSNINDFDELIAMEQQKIDEIETDTSILPQLQEEQNKVNNENPALQKEISRLQDLCGQGKVIEDQAKNKKVTKVITVIGFILLVLGLIGLWTGYLFDEYKYLIYLGIVLDLVGIVILLILTIKTIRKNKKLQSFMDESQFKTTKEIQKAIDKKTTLFNDNVKKLNEINRQIVSIEAKQQTPLQLKQYEVEKQRYIEKLQDSNKKLDVAQTKKAILEEAIESWKQNSQPQFYVDVSKYFEIMTNGKWNKVFVEDNQIYVSGKDTLTPDYLSLSTRQQLYLALRIAVLVRPESQGTNIPVLCDDILVNFDEERRRGAIKALTELSKYKQVIMFTCHKEIVRAARRVHCINL